MGRFFRVLIGFAAACLAAAYTKLLFATTPAELAAMNPDLAADRLTDIADKGWKFAILFGLFSLPFAIVALAIGEWRSLRSWTYYALVALGIALVGFVAQWQSQAPNAAYDVARNYAFTAYLMTGFMAGLTYWLFSGRLAGGPAEQYPVGIDTASKSEMEKKAEAKSAARTEVATTATTAVVSPTTSAAAATPTVATVAPTKVAGSAPPVTRIAADAKTKVVGPGNPGPAASTEAKPVTGDKPHTKGASVPSAGLTGKKA